jgi:hypothetical protein
MAGLDAIKGRRAEPSQRPCPLDGGESGGRDESSRECAPAEQWPRGLIQSTERGDFCLRTEVSACGFFLTLQMQK